MASGREVLGRPWACANAAGAFQDDVDAELAPWELRRVRLGQHPDLVAIDDERPVTLLDRARKAAVHGVVAKQGRQCGDVCDVVDGDDLDCGVAFVGRAKQRAADATKAVDGNSDGHGSPRGGDGCQKRYDPRRRAPSGFYRASCP